MKLESKTALGIDISSSRINLALLRKTNGGIVLVKTASGPVPEGAIKNGNIEDPALLARGIRELRTRNRIRVRLRQASVSMFTKPMLMQIMEIPKNNPAGVGQFLHNEVKHCVAFSGKKIALDYCGIGSGGRIGNDRAFVVAADNQKVAQILNACTLSCINVETVEPPLISYIRAFYNKIITGRFDCYVLLAVLQRDILNLCVFRKQGLDFVRTREIVKEKTGTSELCQWVASEINTIIQFYDIEAPDNPGKWEITVAVEDGIELRQNAEEFLKAKIACEELQVRTSEDTYQDIPIKQGKATVEKNVSVAAIGLALKLLEPNQNNLNINLLPSETAEVKSLKRHALITGNIISMLILVIVLAIGGLMFKINRVNANIAQTKQQQKSLQNLSNLIKESKLLDVRIEHLSEMPNQLKKISKAHRHSDWFGFLNDLGSRAPKTVCITDVFSQSKSGVCLKGLALSYESVHLFVNMLDKSEHVDSASLEEAEKYNEESELVRYSISCSLKSREGN